MVVTWSLSRQQSGTTQYLYSVTFTGPDSGWAVGDGGNIIHYVVYPRRAFLPLVLDSQLIGW